MSKSLKNYSQKILGVFRGKKTLTQQEQVEFIKEAKKDSRRHQRFTLCTHDIAFVITSKGHWLPLANISFAGFGIYLPTTKYELPLSEELTINILGDEIKVFAKQSYNTSVFAGYSFKVEDSKRLIQLKDMLNFLKFGYSLKKVGKNLLKAEYQSKEWVTLRGEGPTDLIYKLASNNELEELILSFRELDTYKELRFYKKKLSTGQSIDAQGVASRMQDSREVDPVILKQSLQILLGVNDNQSIAIAQTVVYMGIKELI